MVGNLLNILVGLWLAYSAIFANPAGAMNNAALAAAAVAVVFFAVWARQTDALGWQSGTNTVLAAVLLVLAVLRWVIGVAPRHRGRRRGDVVTALSASNDSVCRVFVRSRSNQCAICSVAEVVIAAGRVFEGAGQKKTERLAGPSSCTSEGLISPSALALVDRAPRFPGD